MPKDPIKISYIGSQIVLEREQWRGHSAYISDYPGLLDAVLSYTWTYSETDHPYLRCGKLNKTLHYFVLAYLYGQNVLDEVLANDNIIEHLDNNGLNCTYENLHIISSDMNKAKAFSIDKMQSEDYLLPKYTTDVYYDHSKEIFQMQLFFNIDLYWNVNTGVPLQMMICLYSKFENLYIDWFYILNSRKKEVFDISKLHYDKVHFEERPLIKLKPEEKDALLIERDGQYYLQLKYGEDNRFTLVSKTAKRKLD